MCISQARGRENHYSAGKYHSQASMRMPYGPGPRGRQCQPIGHELLADVKRALLRLHILTHMQLGYGTWSRHSSVGCHSHAFLDQRCISCATDLCHMCPGQAHLSNFCSTGGARAAHIWHARLQRGINYDAVQAHPWYSTSMDEEVPTPRLLAIVINHTHCCCIALPSPKDLTYTQAKSCLAAARAAMRAGAAVRLLASEACRKEVR